MRVIRSFLVGLAALLALLPLLLALAGKSVLLVKLSLPYVDGILHHAFVRSLFATDDAHQSQMLTVAIAVFHLHLVGVGSSKWQHTAQYGHVHRYRYTHQ